VQDNLRVATYALSKDDAKSGIARALELFPELEKRWTVTCRLLSGGEQQMVVLAQALVSHPRVILVDELSLGLAPVVVKRLAPALQAVAATGVGVLLIEQFAHVALGLANRAYVLEGGRIRYEGTAKELTEQPELLRSAYLLRGHAAPALDTAALLDTSAPAQVQTAILDVAARTAYLSKSDKFIATTRSSFDLYGSEMMSSFRAGDRVAFYAPVQFLREGSLEQGAILLFGDRACFAWSSAGLPRGECQMATVPIASMRNIGEIDISNTAQPSVTIQAEERWEIVFYPLGKCRIVASLFRGLLTGSITPQFEDGNAATTGFVTEPDALDLS
jgi:hypothetical protein